MRLQFCRDDSDISSDPYAEDDATEVRAWNDSDECLVEVSVDDAGQWGYSGSDFGCDPSLLDATFDSWREALTAHGVGD